MSKTFYCMHCEEEVECEEEFIQENKGDEPGDCEKGYFCKLCGRQLGNEPDADFLYEMERDRQLENE